MVKYALVRPDEDGSPIMFIENVEEFLEDPRGYCGVTDFVEKYSDPNYWDEGEGMLLKIEVLKPVLKTKEWSL